MEFDSNTIFRKKIKFLIMIKSFKLVKLIKNNLRICEKQKKNYYTIFNIKKFLISYF